MSEHPAAGHRPSRSAAEAAAGGRSSCGARSEPTSTGWQPLREPGGAEPRPVADSLPAVAKAIGGDGGPVLVHLIQRWSAIVGDAVAAHSTPLSLRNGTLTIAADEPAWGAQIRWLEADLKVRLDGAIGPGKVTRIAVRVRPRE